MDLRADGKIVLISEHDWFYKIITSFNESFNEGTIHSNYNIIPNTQLSPDNIDITSRHHNDELWWLGDEIPHHYDLFDGDMEPKTQYARDDGDGYHASAKVFVKIEIIEAEVENMVKAFLGRPNQESDSTKYILNYTDMKDDSHKFIFRGIANEILSKEHKLKFTGTAIEKLIKKPKQKTTLTREDEIRSELFMDTFDEMNDGKKDLTRLAMQVLVHAIAQTTTVSYDKFNTAYIKRVISTRCFNEVLHAKMCGANDLLEEMGKTNTYLSIHPSNYLDSGRSQLLKRQFSEYCDNDKSDEIFGEIIKQIDSICTKTTQRKRLKIAMVDIFRKFDNTVDNEE